MRGRRARAQRERERGRTQKSPTQIIDPTASHPKTNRPRPKSSSSTQIVVLDCVAFPENRSSSRRLSSNPVAIAAPIGFGDLACRRTQSQPDYEFFFLGVICVSGLRNEIIIFVWQRRNLRKCEQEVENVFSMVFSSTQPNTRKYFSQYFPKYNQTLENIFLSGK